MNESTFHFVTVGGSITTGHAASEPTSGGWAALVARSLATRFGKLEFRNRGVSGTDSAFAALRIASHAEGADLFVVEFAVTDQWLDPTLRRQTFEGCLRQILCCSSRPRVLCLFLAEQGGPQGPAAEQRVIADHYGVPWVDAGLAPGPGGWNPGHARIAEAVTAALDAVLSAPTPCPITPRDLRDPLYSSDWQFVRFWDHRNAVGEAELAVTVTGKAVGVLYSEGEPYRDLEAWVDDPVPVRLEAPVASRRGSLGWAFRVLTRGLSDGEHRVTLRFGDEGRGRGGPAHVVVVAAGVTDSGRRFLPGAGNTGPWSAPADLPLVWTGRFDPAALPGAKFGWQLTQLSGRFTGPHLALSFGEVVDRNEFAVVVDGRCRVLELLAPSPRTVTIADDLGPGDHRLEVVKRSEGLFGSATLAGLALAPGERWREPGPRPAYRLEVYGDSITAGACNEDGPVDQYDTLATHDPSLSYSAIAARRLGAEIVNLAVSGTGLTCSWNPILMPDVWDRAAPSPDAPRIAADRVPHAVVVNLGQNDYGFPNSQGLPFDPAYGPRLRALVLGLRARYPDTRIVGALGGMTGWKECEPLRRLWTETFDDLQAADPRIRAFFFQAAASAHPRVDVHALLAEELTVFLAREVWPHLETPLH